MRRKLGFLCILGATLSLMLAGCGGDPLDQDATISGRVTFRDGLPARDVRVYTSLGKQTRTSSNGAYTLTDNPGRDIVIFAEGSQNGITYRGRNTVRGVAESQQTSVNIVIAETNRLASMRGTVRSPSGSLLVGARVFAYNLILFNSAVAVTNSQGEYELRDLLSGEQYTVQAGAPDYRNDTDTLTLSAGENRTFNFQLGIPGFASLPIPANFRAITWVSPTQSGTRSSAETAAYEAIKQQIDPNRVARPATRLSNDGSPVEVQLEWDRLQGDDFYGYAIYRGTGSSGTIVDYDFLREPLAGSFIDVNPSLISNQRYRYQIAALGTSYLSDPSDIGNRTSPLTVDTLGDLRATASRTAGDLTFSWNSNSGATAYAIYVWDQFPTVTTPYVWRRDSPLITNTSFFYDVLTNPGGFISGRTYYYVVLGVANSNSSRTLSRIGSFQY
jgi:hypothetical protein